jgi:hypothetical protein
MTAQWGQDRPKRQEMWLPVMQFAGAVTGQAQVSSVEAAPAKAGATCDLRPDNLRPPVSDSCYLPQVITTTGYWPPTFTEQPHSS